ncbi:MAG: hypothetical protein O2887_12595 [Bacteroidetes bacterium]|nr:hypothetical protein [Bacteroidota bacterium]MDA1121308.1 hypothetical protein [Bacteroidota bacterium]
MTFTLLFVIALPALPVGRLDRAIQAYKLYWIARSRQVVGQASRAMTSLVLCYNHCRTSPAPYWSGWK